MPKNPKSWSSALMPMSSIYKRRLSRVRGQMTYFKKFGLIRDNLNIRRGRK